MYLWNTRALVEDLKHGPLPEIEQLKYFLFAAVLAAADAALPSDPTEPPSLPAWGSVLLAVLLVFLGTVWCFRTNAAGDNRDFVSRFLALHVPVGLRLGVLLFGLGLLFVAILGSTFLVELSTRSGAVGDIAFAALTALVFYWRLNVRIKEVSHVG